MWLGVKATPETSAPHILDEGRLNALPAARPLHTHWEVTKTLPEGSSAGIYTKGINARGRGTPSPDLGTRAERVTLVSVSWCGLQTTSLGSFSKVQSPGPSPQALTAGLW